MPQVPMWYTEVGRSVRSNVRKKKKRLLNRVPVEFVLGVLFCLPLQQSNLYNEEFLEVYSASLRQHFTVVTFELHWRGDVCAAPTNASDSRFIYTLRFTYVHTCMRYRGAIRRCLG